MAILFRWLVRLIAAALLIMVFAVMLGWLPATGRGPVGHILGIETSLTSLSALAQIRQH